jgi:DNA invertase Pin-like site-specific DNA recombinase
MNETPLAEAGVNRGGRPRRQVDPERVQQLQAANVPLREIARRLGIGYGTLCRAVRTLRNDPELIQNPAAEVL